MGLTVCATCLFIDSTPALRPTARLRKELMWEVSVRVWGSAAASPRTNSLQGVPQPAPSSATAAMAQTLRQEQGSSLSISIRPHHSNRGSLDAHRWPVPRPPRQTTKSWSETPLRSWGWWCKRCLSPPAWRMTVAWAGHIRHAVALSPTGALWLPGQAPFAARTATCAPRTRQRSPSLTSLVSVSRLLERRQGK